MFTGIIEEIGKIRNVQHMGKGVRIEIACKKIMTDLKIGESVSVNGICLTVVERTLDTFSVEAVEETIKKTTISLLKVSTRLNLERAMKVSDRFGGHFVQGHVDCVGTIQKIEKRAESWAFWFNVSHGFEKYLIPQGSIAIDGVSLTIAELHDTTVMVSIIPHTFKETIFHFYKKNMKVNVEFDMLGKYVVHLLERSPEKKRISLEKLRNTGF